MMAAGDCPHCGKAIVDGDAIYSITGAHYDCYKKAISPTDFMRREMPPTKLRATNFREPFRNSKQETDYDTKCPDGFTCYGWRRINKGGYVRFAGERHYHDDLALHIGQFIYVTLRDMWGINVDVWLNGPWQEPPTFTLNEREWKESSDEQQEQKS